MSTLCKRFINICQAVKTNCLEETEFKNGSKVDLIEEAFIAWNTLDGPFIYIVAMLALFASVISVLMFKVIVLEKPESDLTEILLRMRDREREERERIDRLRLLLTRNKVHRWLVYRNSPVRQKEKGRKNSRRTSVTDFVMDVMPSRIKKDRRRSSIAIPEMAPDIVVTDNTTHAKRKRFDSRWPSVDSEPVKMEKPREHLALRDALSPDSLDVRMRPRSMNSLLSLKFDFDVMSVCGEGDGEGEEGFGSNWSIAQSCRNSPSPSNKSFQGKFQLDVPKLSSSSFSRLPAAAARTTSMNRAMKPKLPRVASLQNENW